MIVYIIMIMISLFFTYLSVKTEDKLQKIVYIVLTMIPFIVVSGFRYDVGTDYLYRYVPDFNSIANGIDVENLEKGFKLIIKLCLLFSNNSQLLFIITSILITVFMIAGINKNSKNILISVLIFGIGGFFFQSLNLVRQFLAMSIVFFAYQYLLKKHETKWYILAVIIAFFIHNSSIIMAVLILCRKKLIFNPWAILVIISIIFVFKNTILQVLTPFIENTRFDVYLIGKYAKGYTSVLYNLVNFAIYSFMIIFYKTKMKNQMEELCLIDDICSEDKLLINIQALALIFTVMSSMHMLFARISYYFSIFQILSIPYFIETTRIKEVHLGEKGMKKILYGLVILFFLSLTFYTNVVHNNNEPLPYISVFDKERKFN